MDFPITIASERGWASIVSSLRSFPSHLYHKLDSSNWGRRKEEVFIIINRECMNPGSRCKISYVQRRGKGREVNQ